MKGAPHRLGDMTWPEIPPRPTVLVPLGSTEQHGPHLATCTDATVATIVAEALAQRIGKPVLVAPALNYGSSGEHQSFPGTVSIGSEVLRLLIVELVRSIASWAGRIVFVNAHGGNVEALSEAVGQLNLEQHDVAWLPCSVAGADLHAGRTETSLMLYLRPEAVRPARFEPGEARPLNKIFHELVTGGVAAVSPSGVLGNPLGATAAEGRELLQRMIDDSVRRMVSGVSNPRGMLVSA